MDSGLAGRVPDCRSGFKSREWERRLSRSSRKRSGEAATSRDTVCHRLAPIRNFSSQGDDERADRTCSTEQTCLYAVVPVRFCTGTSREACVKQGTVRAEIFTAMRILLWPRYDGRHPTCALVLGVCKKRLDRVTTMRWWSLQLESTPVGNTVPWQMTQQRVWFRSRPTISTDECYEVD